MKDIDIAMLFLNAGVLSVAPFKDQPEQDIEAEITVNVMHPVYLCKALLD